MAIFSKVKNLISVFETKNFSELPHGISSGIEKYIKEDEEVLATILNWRAIYRAPKFADSNTYFNSWFILTNHRIIIARNSSVFKRFRDIPLSGITQIYYELDRSRPKVTINSPGHEDVIEFPKQASHHCANLEQTINEAIGQLRNTINDMTDKEHVFCTNCGNKVILGSHFCSACGVRLQNP